MLLIFTSRGVLRYYERFSKDTNTPFTPYVRGFDLSIRYLGELTCIDVLIGIKYAIPDAIKLGVDVEPGDTVV